MRTRERGPSQDLERLIRAAKKRQTGSPPPTLSLSLESTYQAQARRLSSMDTRRAFRLAPSEKTAFAHALPPRIPPPPARARQKSRLSWFASSVSPSADPNPRPSASGQKQEIAPKTKQRRATRRCFLRAFARVPWSLVVSARKARASERASELSWDGRAAAARDEVLPSSASPSHAFPFALTAGPRDDEHPPPPPLVAPSVCASSLPRIGGQREKQERGAKKERERGRGKREACVRARDKEC